MKRFFILLSSLFLLFALHIGSTAETGEEGNPLISWTESQYGTSGLVKEMSSAEEAQPGERSFVFEGVTGSTGTYNYLYSTSNLSSRNCYGYAIGVNQLVNPGYLCGISVSSYQHDAYRLRDAVIGDLNALGYTNAHVVSASYTPASGETKIGFRLGFESNGTFVDYHFMVWDASGYWLHKPGTTSILKYKYTSISNSWIPEACINGLWYMDTSFSYNGTIMYVAF